MKWEKKGLIYSPNASTNSSNWMNNSILQPTPLILHDKIRVYAGFRDCEGRSRIGFVDLNKENLTVLNVSEKPVLDIGKAGYFDENGVTPTVVIRVNDTVRIYYAGYSLGTKVRFTGFTGLAISNDDGETFTRYQETPVADRVKSEELFRAIHSIIKDENSYKVWYGAGNKFLEGNKKTLPVYDIRYMESNDGINFPTQGSLAIPVSGNCHRVGRPYVFKENGIYKMFYGFGSEDLPYQLAYAESLDGKNWKQKDINLPLSKEGWDSQMMAYPAFVRVNGKGILFYNGNNYGYDGFGYAELIEE